MQILAIASLKLMYASASIVAEIRFLPPATTNEDNEEECAFGAEISQAVCALELKAVQFGEELWTTRLIHRFASLLVMIPEYIPNSWRMYSGVMASWKSPLRRRLLKGS